MQRIAVELIFSVQDRLPRESILFGFKLEEDRSMGTKLRVIQTVIFSLWPNLAKSHRNVIRRGGFSRLRKGTYLDKPKFFFVEVRNRTIFNEIIAMWEYFSFANLNKLDLKHELED
jgi:hypothetical protein